MKFEGCSLGAYTCPAGKLTIGFGHTGDVSEGQRITQHQAEEILEFDLERFEKVVADLCPDAGPNEFSALVCFVFNLGAAALGRSTLLRKFLDGDREGAAEEFGKWVYAKGEILPGLVARRAAERALFLERPS